MCECGRAVSADAADARMEEAKRVLQDAEASERKGELLDAR